VAYEIIDINRRAEVQRITNIIRNFFIKFIKTTLYYKILPLSRPMLREFKGEIF
jgi:hypothetical protein